MEKRFGEIRGGASPLLHQKHYWCVFQSHKRFNFIGTVYYIGVFLFDAKPPFKPFAMSINPIIKLDIEDTSKANHLRLNKRSFIGIYPCGAHFDDDNLIVSYGIHDSFCCLKK